RLVRHAEDPTGFLRRNCSLTSLGDICSARPYRVAALAFVQIYLAQIGNVLRASEILAKGNWDIGALDRAGIELPRPANALRRILDHLFPLGDPPDGAGDGEQHREHVGREAERLQGDAGIEVDVGVELLLDAIVFVER